MYTRRLMVGFVPISIHAPHEGERLQRGGQPQHGRHISIHAPHEGERQSLLVLYVIRLCDFNPRSPRGGATSNSTSCSRTNFAISIHAPHEGERLIMVCLLDTRKQISIHAPHEGERPDTGLGSAQPIRFQSTLPTRGSDLRYGGKLRRAFPISIHAPHEGERPAFRQALGYPSSYFNPRSPRGGATAPVRVFNSPVNISIHAPHEGERPALLTIFGVIIW